MTACPCWSLFGLTVRSELPLPFETLGSPDEADVTVRFDALPPCGPTPECGPGALQFEWPEAGRFRIVHGREIVIDPAPDASERNLRVYLLGSAFGIVLHQRGLLPLHANAVLIDGRAVAFMGHSGAGKSTLAAWFQDRGHTVLADDVCAVATGAGGPQALPGVPRLRLWRDAVESSGRDPGDFERSFDGRDKFDIPSPGAAAPAAAAPLAAIYLLEEGEVELSIEPLNQSEAIEALIANTYRGRHVHVLGATARHFQACVELGRQVPVQLVRRRKDVAAFERTARLLEDHARSLLAAAPALVPQ